MALRTSPLAAVHEARGGQMVEFGGWEMPVEFDSIRTEHTAVRESVGMFDVSHMGEITVTGPDAIALTNRLTTNDVARLAPREAQYSAITDEHGVMVDDTIVYRQDEDEVLFVPNAGHDDLMTDRWIDHRDAWGLDATVTNDTDEYAMIAVQGPEAPDHLAPITSPSVGELRWFEATLATIESVECLVSRTGYTGEDGFEILLPWDDAETVWDAVGVQPCGLGARDTLRIEAGFVLSGQDFHHETNPRNPYETGLGFTVKLDTEFVGRDALERVVAEGTKDRFVGLELIDRGIPRTGYPITRIDGVEIGVVTSGTMSPTLDIPIGLGYVPVDHAEPGTSVRVVIRDQPKKAKIRPTSFIEQ